MRRSLICLVIISGTLGVSFAAIRLWPLRVHFLLLTGTVRADDSVYPLQLYTVPLMSGVDSLCVVKHRRALFVYHGGVLLKIYRVALGDAPAGHKHFEGDEHTPEGLYFINGRNPASSCHKNLGISYPNIADRAFARRAGKAPGGDIKIHGLPNGQGYIGAVHIAKDWTNGCVAVTDGEIDELYAHTSVGIPILILP